MKKISLEMYVAILQAALNDKTAQSLIKEYKECFAYERDKNKLVDELRYKELRHEKEKLLLNSKEYVDFDDRLAEIEEKISECFAIKKDENKIIAKEKFIETMTQINTLNEELSLISSVSRGKTKILEGKETRFTEIVALLTKLETTISDCYADVQTEDVLYSKQADFERLTKEIDLFAEKYLHEPLMIDDVELIDKIEREYGVTYYDVDALSVTGMKKLIRSPATYQYFMENSQKKSKDFVVGQLLHCMVLEPDKVTQRFMRMEFSGTTKEGKEERAYAKEHGLEPINASDFDQCINMAEAILNHPEAGKFFSQQVTRHCEVEYYMKRVVNGVSVPCKAKADQRFILPNGAAFLLDVKTTKDAYVTPENVAQTIFKYGYHIQDAWYLEMDKRCNPENSAQDFVFVFVSKEAPHLVTSFTLSSDWIKEGQKMCEKGLELYAECIRDNEYPTGMPESCYVLPMPENYKKERNLSINYDDEEEYSPEM